MNFVIEFSSENNEKIASKASQPINKWIISELQSNYKWITIKLQVNYNQITIEFPHQN